MVKMLYEKATAYGVVPDALLGFLSDLDQTKTSQDVWDLWVDLALGVGIDFVDYVFATDFQEWQKVQFIRTTVPSKWIDFANTDTRVRRLSTFRTHSVKHLMPIVAGPGYLDRYPTITEERAGLLRETGEKFGVRSGVAIPLRMNEPGQAAHVVYACDADPARFEEVFAQDGWALHCGALYAHTRYVELFKLEFPQRNKLTDKQMEILKLVGTGYLDKEIAEVLGISFSTVRQRINALQQKTGCKNRAELAALAVRIGLIPDPMNNLHERELTVFLSTGDKKSGAEHVKNNI